MKISNLLIGIVVAATAPLASRAETARTPAADTEPATLTAAVVKKLDSEQQKITLKHEALINLGMPPMTMVFRLGNAALADNVQVGDRILFRAERLNGAFVVTTLTKPGASPYSGNFAMVGVRGR